MNLEEKIEKLKKAGVDIDIRGDESEFEIWAEDLDDPGPFGGYPKSTYKDSFEEAIDTALYILETGAKVHSIS